MYSPSMPMLEKPDLIPMKFMMGDDEEDEEDEEEGDADNGEDGSNGTTTDVIVASQLPPTSQTVIKEPNPKQRK